jgi:hypothetical protein
MQKALEQTAALWPVVRTAYDWVKRVAEILSKTPGLDANGVRRRFRALLGAMARNQNRSTPTLPAMLAHFRQVPHSYWPGLFHCYRLAALPRPKNELEQFFGAHRYHERRTTGRKGASPALVLRGAVKMAACTATRLRPFEAEALAPANLQDWKTLRQQLESRQQQRVRRYRFRRDPQAYLAALEKNLLQLILPP